MQYKSSYGLEINMNDKEIDLLSKYPKSPRNLDDRKSNKTPENVTIAKQFQKAYFNGSRDTGYGGFNYNKKYWTDVVQDFINFYNLNNNSKVLDVGCAMGYMLHDMKVAIPEINITGVDISQYAIENAKEEVKPYLQVGNVDDLSRFKDKEFDLVICINTIHNLKLEDCKKALRELERVAKHSFLTVDAWRTDEEKERMHNWNLTAETYMRVDDWKALFSEVGYNGEYYWFIP